MYKKEISAKDARIKELEDILQQKVITYTSFNLFKIMLF